MASFTLRDIDRDPRWRLAITRGEVEGWSPRRLILQLLDDYGAGRITPSRPATPAGPEPPPGEPFPPTY